MTPDHLPALDELEALYVAQLQRCSARLTQLGNELHVAHTEFDSLTERSKQAEMNLAAVRSLRATFAASPAEAKRVDL